MDCHIVGREVLVWSGAGSMLVRDACCKLLACAHALLGARRKVTTLKQSSCYRPFALGRSGATRFIFIPQVAPAMSPAMVPCVPAPFDVAVRAEDDLELLGQSRQTAVQPQNGTLQTISGSS